MFKKESESALGWISVIVFFAASFYSLATVDSISVVFQNMLATGGIVNIFYFIFTFGAALVCLLSMDYLKKYDAAYGEFYLLVQTSVYGRGKGFIYDIPWSRTYVDQFLCTCRIKQKEINCQ
jgi:NADH:ubiquinone oxidoreductase subunit 2 (subunit N)